MLDKLEDVKSRIEDIKQRANDIEDFRTQNNNTLTKDNLDTNMNSIQAKKILIQDLL
ncbi:MAG: hypothetical protein U9N59_01605 [Campylobacterota bacterium]|nr:hypothetical protein [Campylobacterota bacterium]